MINGRFTRRMTALFTRYTSLNYNYLLGYNMAVNKRLW